MTHEWARASILANKAERLDATEQRRLERHLAACSACRTHAEQVERGLAAFRSHAPLADASLAHRTRALLRARARQAEPHPWVPLAASILAGAAFVPWLLLSQRLVDWCRTSLDMAAMPAMVSVGLAWLTWWALGAVATILAVHRPAESNDEWPSAAAKRMEVQNGTR